MIDILLFLFVQLPYLSADTGCSDSQPALCKIDPITKTSICKEKYEDCEGFEGCTNPDMPYICSNGECAENFLKCSMKYFNCENLR